MDQETDSPSIEALFKSLKAESFSLRHEPVRNRKTRLLRLKQWLHTNLNRLNEAAYADLRKPQVEFNAIEILYVFNEIKTALKHLDQWARPKLVDAPVEMLGTRSEICFEPRGICLIISPWNYPFSLNVGPLVSAIAAGNTVVLKPSELTPHISSEISRMVNEVFDRKVVAVIEGGADVSKQLLRLPFDHIFFTGSSRVGKLVMKAAAENLASVTLELGGKSPAIVTNTARIKDAAQRIAVSKFVNAGQTCVAPDYVCVDEKIVDEFINQLIHYIKYHFADKSTFTKIINQDHFNRLDDLVTDAIAKGATVVYREDCNPATLSFFPVLLTNVTPNSRIMEEEIFGPILPVVSYSKLEETIVQINTQPKPLGLYLFSQSEKERKSVFERTSSGGMCVNDCAIQFLHHRLPFGGVNSSGFGKSHGHAGYLAFSNVKPVLRQANGLTIAKFLYPPYRPFTKKLLNGFLKLFHR